MPKITAITTTAPKTTYDIQVDTAHEFIANGVVVHNCLGLYHPHSDMGTYEALVNMTGVHHTNASTWLRRNTNEPLISGRGNFGDFTDSAASMRYCVVASTSIATPKGWILIADLPAWESKAAQHHALYTQGYRLALPNTLVMSADATTTPATFWINSGIQDTVRVTLNNGRSIQCTPDHPFLVYRRDGKVWKEAQFLTSKDVLVAIAPYFGHTPLTLPTFSGFPAQLNSDIAYLLGSCTSNQFPYLRKSPLLSSICAALNIDYRDTGKGWLLDDFTTDYLRSIRPLIQQAGCAESLYYLKAVVYQSCFWENAYHIQIDDGFFVQSILSKFAITSRVLRRVLHVEGNSVLRLQHLLDITPNLWLRLQQKWLQPSPNIVGTQVRSVVRAGKQWVYDLTVPATNSYVANGIVVHNTEAKLSEYAENYLLDPDYLAVSPMLPNYSDDHLEPVILPAKLPNLLINGSEGIAVGVSSLIPSFKRDAVRRVARLAVKKCLTEAKAFDILAHNICSPYGGHVIDIEPLHNLLTTGEGVLVWRPDYDITTSTFKIISFCPRLNLTKVRAKIAALDDTASIRNETGDDGVCVVVVPKQKDPTLVAGWHKQILEILEVRISYKMSATIRNTDGSVQFVNTSLLHILNTWADWRLRLEHEVLTSRLAKLDLQMLRLTTHILAIKQLPKVLAALKQPDPSKQLQQQLKISSAQAQQILTARLHKLSVQHLPKLKQQESELRLKLTDLHTALQQPLQSVLSTLCKS